MRRIPVALVAILAFFAAAQTATAGDCGVISDYNSHGGVIDGSYSIPCLKQALNSVHGDTSVYTEIVPVIQAKIYAERRAAQLAKDGQSGGGSDGNRTGSGAEGSSPATSSSAGAGSSTSSKSGHSGSTGSKKQSGATTTDPAATTSASTSALGATAPPAANASAAIDGLSPKKDSSVPVPVIVLGIVALGLIAIGAAGLISRRRRA